MMAFMNTMDCVADVLLIACTAIIRNAPAVGMHLPCPVDRAAIARKGILQRLMACIITLNAESVEMIARRVPMEILAVNAE